MLQRTGSRYIIIAACTLPDVQRAVAMHKKKLKSAVLMTADQARRLLFPKKPEMAEHIAAAFGKHTCQGQPIDRINVLALLGALCCVVHEEERPESKAGIAQLVALFSLFDIEGNGSLRRVELIALLSCVSMGLAMLFGVFDEYARRNPPAFLRSHFEALVRSSVDSEEPIDAQRFARVMQDLFGLPPFDGKFLEAMLLVQDLLMIGDNRTAPAPAVVAGPAPSAEARNPSRISSRDEPKLASPQFAPRKNDARNTRGLTAANEHPPPVGRAADDGSGALEANRADDDDVDVDRTSLCAESRPMTAAARVVGSASDLVVVLETNESDADVGVSDDNCSPHDVLPETSDDTTSNGACRLAGDNNNEAASERQPLSPSVFLQTSEHGHLGDMAHTELSSRIDRNITVPEHIRVKEAAEEARFAAARAAEVTSEGSCSVIEDTCRDDNLDSLRPHATPALCAELDIASISHAAAESASSSSMTRSEEEEMPNHSIVMRSKSTPLEPLTCGLDNSHDVLSQYEEDSEFLATDDGATVVTSSGVPSCADDDELSPPRFPPEFRFSATLLEEEEEEEEKEEEEGDLGLVGGQRSFESSVARREPWSVDYLEGGKPGSRLRIRPWTSADAAVLQDVPCVHLTGFADGIDFSVLTNSSAVRTSVELVSNPAHLGARVLFWDGTPITKSGYTALLPTFAARGIRLAAWGEGLGVAERSSLSRSWTGMEVADSVVAMFDEASPRIDEAIPRQPRPRGVSDRAWRAVSALRYTSAKHVVCFGGGLELVELARHAKPDVQFHVVPVVHTVSGDLFEETALLNYDGPGSERVHIYTN